MTTERRIKALEERIASNDEKCILVDWGSEAMPKCPKGIMVSKDLHECGVCSVPEKRRTVIRIRWIPGAAKCSNRR